MHQEKYVTIFWYNYSTQEVKIQFRFYKKMYHKVKNLIPAYLLY